MLDHTTIWIGRGEGEDYAIYGTKPSLSRTPETCHVCNHKSQYLEGKTVFDSICASAETFKLLPWIEDLLDSEMVELQLVFVSKSEAVPKPKRVRKKRVKKAK
ncbi:hypothetical protein LCGC14_2367350 [marine sediment metagenome]|uniref:Uncharacterized protein n=1 Tax=marine sediment metagenome TaxID=412755 RepID=A0A0F9EZM7_9ZZZZ